MNPWLSEPFLPGVRRRRKNVYGELDASSLREDHGPFLGMVKRRRIKGLREAETFMRRYRTRVGATDCRTTPYERPEQDRL